MILKNETESARDQMVETLSASDESPGKDPASEDGKLVARVKKGVPWASENLVKQYYTKAYALAFQMCDANTDEAQDVTQQAFLKALGNIDKFKGNASFKTWFYRILVNTCLDARRRRRRWLGIFTFPRAKSKDGASVPLSPDNYPDEKKSHHPELSWRRQQLRRDIREAMGKLPEKQRVIFQLKVLQEFSIPEIADIMAIAQGTVKSHLFRATRSMRKSMADWKEVVE